MSDDIVARLRQPILADIHPLSIHARTMSKAADEITRLRAELAAAKAELADAHYILDQLGAPRDDEHDEPLKAMERVHELMPSHLRAEAAEAERDEMRGLIREARPFVHDTIGHPTIDLQLRMDAAIKGFEK